MAKSAATKGESPSLLIDAKIEALDDWRGKTLSHVRALIKQAVPGVVEEYIENTALGRPGTPEDIAEAVVFLCSPQSSWMTGEILDLNGGARLKRYPNINEHLTRLMNQ